MTYFVVWWDIEPHDSVQEGLRGLVVGEEGVPVDVVQVTELRQGAAWRYTGHVTGIQT